MNNLRSMDDSQFQFDDSQCLRHFLTIEGMKAQLLHELMDLTESFLQISNSDVKNIPLLRGKTVANLFFENSTRTIASFELAEKRLSADILNLNIATSSAKKGESLLDTIRTLEAMQADVFVVRHQSSGAAYFIAQHVKPETTVINAGDGWHAHPSQALLDMYTIRRHKKNFVDLKVAIVGDIAHSRVARSNIHALSILGVNSIHVIAPKTLLPKDVEQLGVHVHHNLQTGLADADVVMVLRLQQERMEHGLLPSTKEYYQHYGIDEKSLRYAKPDAIVMHPGPLNRNVEISSQVADSSQSTILEQVNVGIAARMAILALTLGVQ